MIPRYSRPEMVAIWEPQTRFRIWFEIEAHATDKLAELGVVPKEAAATIWAKAKDATFDVARIDEIERVTKHDVIAFLTHLAEIVGPEARFVHQGMTSSDILDTTLSVQLARATDILIADVDALLAAIKRRAFEHKFTPTIGRSPRHPCRAGDLRAQARPGLCRVRSLPGAGSWRRVRRSRPARSRVRSARLPTSTRASRPMSPTRWASRVEPVSTQVIPRDRHAACISPRWASIASSIERLATEIRHLQRTEVL